MTYKEMSSVKNYIQRNVQCEKLYIKKFPVDKSYSVECPAWKITQNEISSMKSDIQRHLQCDKIKMKCPLWKMVFNEMLSVKNETQ